MPYKNPSAYKTTFPRNPKQKDMPGKSGNPYDGMGGANKSGDYPGKSKDVNPAMMRGGRTR